MCKAGFTGQDCSVDIDECETGGTVCFNGGTCVNTVGSWRCNCARGTSGPLCKTRQNFCDPNPCYGNGVCLDHGHSAKCVCSSGFYGGFCENECPFGYEGENCEKETEKSLIITEVEVNGLCKKNRCNEKFENGVCDEECNHLACNFDGGECSKPFAGCHLAEFCERVFRDGICDKQCNSENCLFDGFDCAPIGEFCKHEGWCEARYGDGHCDEECNNVNCLFDGNDCVTSNETQALRGSVILVALISRDEFAKQISHFLLELSRMLRASVKIRIADEQQMIFDWKLGSLKGTMVVIDVDVSECHLLRGATKCFSDVTAVASFLNAANEKQMIGSLGIPVYSAYAEIEESGTPVMRKMFVIALTVVILFMALFLTVADCVRKRRIVHVEKTWYPPNEESCVSSVTNLDRYSLNSAILFPGNIGSKRQRTEPIPLAVPEIYEVSSSSSISTTEETEDDEELALLHSQASSSQQIGYPVSKSVVNARGKCGRTAMMLAAVNPLKEESMSIADINILKASGANIDQRGDAGETALMLAICAGRNNVARHFIKLGADPCVVDEYGRTALHHAVAVLDFTVVSILLTNDAVDVNKLDDYNNTPLMLSAKYELDGTQIAEALLDAGADPSNCGDINSLEYNGKTALHYAAQLCNIGFIQLLVRRGASPDIINAQDRFEQTPLLLAASEGHLEVVNLLLGLKASHTTDHMGRSPRDIAIERKFFEIVKRLDETSATLRIRHPEGNKTGRSRYTKAPIRTKRPLVKKIAPTIQRNLLGVLTPPQSDLSGCSATSSPGFRSLYFSRDRQNYSQVPGDWPYMLPHILSPPSDERSSDHIHSALTSHSNEWIQTENPDEPGRSYYPFHGRESFRQAAVQPSCRLYQSSEKYV